MKPNMIFYTLFTALLLALLSTVWSSPVHAAGNTYTISSPGSCTAFLTAIGATGQEADDICYVYSGILPAGDTLTVGSDQMLRPQTEAFTNRGTINITASATYYGAGTFTNEGTLNIVSTGSRFGGGQNYATINNAGTINIAASSDFFNGGTINNATTGTITNEGNFRNAGVINNAGGTANTGVLSHIVTLSTGACGILNNTGTLTGNSPIDKCPPTASPSQSPMANNTGWNNTDVTVTWNWSDNIGGSGLDEANCTTSSVSSGEGQLTLSATCQDHAGNVGSANYTVKVDKSSPVANPSQSPPANGAGWNNRDVTVDWNWSDVNGLDTARCTTRSTSSGEGTLTLTATCQDIVGNVGTASYIVKVDKTAPTISAVVTTQPNSNGWYNSNVTVRFTCADTLSGVTSCPADQVLSSEGAAVASTAQTVVDQAGNSSAASNVVTVKIDKTAPTISAAATGTPNANAWYNSDVTVQFTCADGLSGVASCPTAETLSSEGAAVASTAQTVTDLAGNSSSASNVVTVKIDKTAPTISAAATTQPNANGWYTSDVTVHFTCADTLSGVTSCPADEILSNEGSAVASTAQSITDLAGNNSASNVVTVKLDKTAPVVTVTGVSAGASYPLGNVPTAGCSTTDAVAGVATQATLSVSGGSQGVGNFTATCSPATDQAGNASTAVSAAYTVVYGENSFVVLTQEGVAIAQNVTINSGSVGARLAGTGPFLANNAEVSFAQNSQMLDAASYLLGNRLVIQQNARVANVSYNSWSNAGTVRGVAVTPLNLALLPTLPPLPTITPGTQNLSVGQNGTLTLTPGSYGSLTVAQNATVTFVGGLYHFTGWTVAQNAKLYFQAASDIRIAGRLNSAQNVFIGPATTAPTLSAREIVLTVAGQNGTTGTLNATPKAVVFGQNSRLHLNLLAPNGTVQVEENSQATGAIFARWATFGQAVRLTLASRFGATGVTATAAMTPTAESAELAPAPVTSEESPSTVTFDHLLYLPVVTR